MTRSIPNNGLSEPFILLLSLPLGCLDVRFIAFGSFLWDYVKAIVSRDRRETIGALEVSVEEYIPEILVNI